MWRYDLHVHTKYSSDGKSSIKEVVSRAEQIGLSGIAITDHNVLKGALEAKGIPSNIEIIPGCEITLNNGKHIIGLYLTKEMNKNDLDSVILDIHNQEGLAMLPHPFRAKSGLLNNYKMTDNNRLKEIASKFDLIEIYNPTCSYNENLHAFNLWKTMKANVIKISASDAHTAWQLGIGQTLFMSAEHSINNTIQVKFKDLIKAEKITREIFIGNYNRILTIYDGRPPIIRVKQLMKKEFPFLKKLYQYFLSEKIQNRSKKRRK